MAVRRIKERCIRRIGFIVLQEGRINSVSIQGDHGSGLDRVNLSAAAGQGAADKTAVVFCRIPLGFCHLGIFLSRLCCTDRDF